MAEIHDGKTYIIMNVASGTVIDLANGDGANGIPIKGYQILVKDGKNLPHQVWKAKLEVSDNTGEWYSFRNYGTGTAIDSGGINGENNQTVCWEYQPSNPNQQWQLVRAPNVMIPEYQLYNATTTRKSHQSWSIDLGGGSSANSTPINFLSSSPLGQNPNQIWMLIQLDI